MAEVIFQIKDLRKRYGKKEVLRGLNFAVHKGEILGIVGKSGAGKSTFLKILSGIIRKYDGSVQHNLNIIGNKPLNEVIGFSFQPYSFYEGLTLRSNLYYFGSLYGMSRKVIMERARHLFELTDLSWSDLPVPAKNLSGGMKKRFDIVCSLLHNPSILILDEPTAGLDPLRRKQLINIVKKIKHAGVTILMSSHIMSDIEQVCDRVLLMDHGKDLVMDTPSNIKSAFLEHEQIVIESYPGNYAKIAKFLSGFNILHTKIEDNKLVIYSPETEVLVHFILHLLEDNGESLQNIVITEPDLGEVFAILEQKGRRMAMRENVQKLNQFIYLLVGKRYSEKKIKEIMMSHRWPKEVVDVLVGKRILRMAKK